MSVTDVHEERCLELCSVWHPQDQYAGMERVFRKTLLLLKLLIRENHKVQDRMFDNLDQLLDVQIVRSDLATALKEVRGEKEEDGDNCDDDDDDVDDDDDYSYEEGSGYNVRQPGPDAGRPDRPIRPCHCS